MRRRDLLAAIGGAAASPMIRPFAARAQQMPVVGILLLSNAAAAKDLALVTELSRLGYVEGRNIAFDIRAAGGDLTRLPALGRELAAARPKVLVGSATTSAEALALATHDIPIVMAVVGDPITAGLTTSMAQPTRNVTGFTMSSSSLAAKRLELLSEMVPNLRKVAYVTPDSPMSGSFRAEVQRAADKLGITLLPLAISTAESVAEGFARAEKEGVQAVLVESSPTNALLSADIVNECLLRDWPAVHAWSFEVRGGALMSYGPAVNENHAGVARYIDRILKGAKVADLPFEEPAEMTLAINLRTARSIKLKMPPEFYIRANEVIE